MTTPRPDESGLEYLRRVFGAEGPGAPIGALLGMTPVVVEPGEVVFELTPSSQHYNPIGSVHGGIAATMLDSAMGCAVHTRLDAGVGFTTADLHVHYVRAIGETTGPIRAEGRVVHVGRRMATAEGRVVDRDGRLYAHGTTTCIVL